ncbi:hypothetical protein GGF44_002539, partial [Coemansia sp. RSA 1694]
MSAHRVHKTFGERGIRPPAKEYVTVGESDLKLIHLRNGEDTGLLQYVRNGGIAFPHIMVPETLQLRSAAKVGGGASIMRKQQERDEASEDAPGSEPRSALAAAVSQALWLWNAKQHASDLLTRAQMQALLRAESWLPALLAQAVFGRVAGSASAAAADAAEVAEAEGQRSMLAKTEGPISCIAWHPHRSLVAIAHRASDAVFL